VAGSGDGVVVEATNIERLPAVIAEGDLTASVWVGTAGGSCYQLDDENGGTCDSCRLAEPIAGPYRLSGSNCAII
jgi:hypothetical protein